MNTAQKILERLESIEKLLANVVHPVQSFSPGGSDWMLTATDEQVRDYNRKKGLERKRQAHERKATPKARGRPKI